MDLVRRQSAPRQAEHVRPGVKGARDLARVVAEGAGLAEERRAVRAALADLPAEQQLVIQLMYFDGLSVGEIADRLGVASGTVRSSTLLGMRELREVTRRIRR